MKKTISPGRGCFDRCDDEFDTAEYASPPCYMHEVDPSYFGFPLTTLPMSDREPNPSKISACTSQGVATQGDTIVPWTRLRTLMKAFSHTFGREAATLIERMEAHRKVRAMARLRARAESKR